MIMNFDFHGHYEIPTITLCTPANVQIGVLNSIKNFKPKYVFNAVSELYFDIYDKIGVEENDCYELIRPFRYILVEDVGYFIIRSCPETIEGDTSFKSVSAISCEFELNNQNLTYFKGTYKFYDEDRPLDTLFGTIMNSFPNWSVGTIDKAVANRSRTFDVPTQTVYSFLMDDVEQSYECILDFDILNRIVNVYDKGNLVQLSNIVLNKKDIVNQITIDDNDDELITALFVTGANDLDILKVNPLGINTIYSFKAYQDTTWMSEGTLNALNVWEKKVKDAEPIFRDLLLRILNKNKECDVLESQLAALEFDLGNYKAEKSSLVEEGANLSDVNIRITNTSIAISNKQAEIAVVQQMIDTLEEERSAINSNLSFSNSFTPEQYAELSCFIRQGDYKEENITQTESMSYEEKQEQSIELYNQAKRLLEKLSEPRHEFSIETSGFVFSKYFKDITSELKIGSIINVEFKEDDIRSHILLSIEVDYESQSCQLVFGNRYRLHSSNNLFDDLTSSIAKSSNTVTYDKDRWNYPVAEGRFDEMQSFINQSIDLTKNALVSSRNIAFELDDTGWHGRKMNEDGTLAPEELWMTNNQLVFSDDNFDSVKTAVGYLVLPNGQKVYGINARVILGDIILSDELTIQNESGSFVVNKDGVFSTQLATKQELKQIPNYTANATYDADRNIINLDILNAPDELPPQYQVNFAAPTNATQGLKVGIAKTIAGEEESLSEFPIQTYGNGNPPLEPDVFMNEQPISLTISDTGAFYNVSINKDKLDNMLGESEVIDNINGSIEDTNHALTEMNESIQTLSSKLTQTSEHFDLEFEQINSATPEKLQNSLTRINFEGIKVGNSTSETIAAMKADGFYIDAKTKKIAHFTTAGTNTTNLHVDEEAVFANLRFMKHTNDETGETRSHIHFIG